AGLDERELRPRLAGRFEGDAGEPGEDLALDDGDGVLADRRPAGDPERDLDPVDVVARELEAFNPSHLDAAHLDAAADLQALQRLALEVDRVVAHVGARAAAREPDRSAGQREDEDEERRADG